MTERGTDWVRGDWMQTYDAEAPAPASISVYDTDSAELTTAKVLYNLVATGHRVIDADGADLSEVIREGSIEFFCANVRCPCGGELVAGEPGPVVCGEDIFHDPFGVSQ